MFNYRKEMFEDVIYVDFCSLKRSVDGWEHRQGTGFDMGATDRSVSGVSSVVLLHRRPQHVGIFHGAHIRPEFRYL